MFRKAVSIARRFTFPVVLMRQTVAGECSSSIGSFVVVNDEGWIVTAGHIFEQLDKLITDAEQVKLHLAEENAIRQDRGLSEADRIFKLKRLGELDPQSTMNCSAWWGFHDVRVKDVSVLKDVDLGVARLDPFDPSKVAAYPQFKRPETGVEQGVSLCKLGFPFNGIRPTWESGVFGFPPKALPLPCFPIEGILTRFIDAQSDAKPDFPTMWIETSSPGLRGQSGGPIFDDVGTVWAIQAHTAHLPLGFNPPVPGGKNGEKEHQFLNVGRGSHPATVSGFLDSLGVKYDKSAF